MGPQNGPVVLAVVFVLVQALAANVQADEDFEPMVAFMCNKPTMHRVVNGWRADFNQDCITESKKGILDYCKKMYPDHDITSIVETSKYIKVPEWPDMSQRKTHAHTVRPYRCIVGTFQSDALLVPQHCVFDHHHDTEICKDFDYWNQTANERCENRPNQKMVKNTFAMLLPCEIDMFNGVEFVCCPEQKESEESQESTESTESSDSYEDDDVEDEDESIGDYPAIISENTKEDAYHTYINMNRDARKKTNEHKMFTEAKKELKKIQEEKMTNLMKEWQAARDHNEELKKTDANLARQEDAEVTIKFKRLYKSFQQEAAAQKIQINALHQQNVQYKYNSLKRLAMDKYISALQNKNAHKVLKYLKAYIRAEEKDRMHTVNHYEHIVYTDKEEAKKIYPHMQEHLDKITERLNQTMAMLAKFPDIERKVLPEINIFRKRYQAVDQSILNIVVGPPETEIVAETSKADDKEESIEESQESQEAVSEEVVVSNEYDPSETTEDEHSYHFAAHAKDDSVRVDQGMNMVAASSSGHIGSTFGIAIGSVSIFVIIVVAIVMLRRRSSRQTVTHGYVEVDPSASPEERHVANMQMNGYENPTYRYFEIAT